MDWKQYLFSATGRLNRGKYWLAFLIYLGISLVGVLVVVSFANEMPATDNAMLYAGIGGVLVYLVMTYSSIVIAIKRLHDRNKSGWWLLVFYGVPGILPLLGPNSDNSAASFVLNLASFAISIWALVELGFRRGTAGPNRFGPDPIQALPSR